MVHAQRYKGCQAQPEERAVLHRVAEALEQRVKRPLLLTEMGERFDILATVAGGGINGQAGAVRLGIARALVEFNAELRKALKKEGLLTSDSRVKERKKYGLAGARKRFQFSKR